MRQYNLHLAQRGILFLCAVQGRDAAFDQQLTTACMRDHRCAGEEAVAPGMIGMIMCIDHISYRYIQFVFDEFADTKGLIWQSQCIDDHCPLRTRYYPCCYLSVYFALEPKNIFGNS